MDEVRSLLVICNKKDEAEYLFHALDAVADLCCHLSASMCPAHRRKTLSKLHWALENGKQCLCIATQVIEAGVDISFERVIRLSAGMDSVIQAAGRCNRHGERDQPVPVYVVPLLGENLSRLQEIQRSKNATGSLLEAFRRDPDRFENDLSSDASIQYYYRKLYGSMPKEYQDYYIKQKNVTLYNLLSCNTKYWDDSSPFCGKFMLYQAFRLAGTLFEVFDDTTRDVVVPYGDGAKLISELAGTVQPDPAFLADWLRRAKAYTVSMYDYQIHSFAGALMEYSGILALRPGYYDESTGLIRKPQELDFLEV